MRRPQGLPLGGVLILDVGLGTYGRARLTLAAWISLAMQVFCGATAG